MSDNNKILAEIRESYRKKERLIPFVGAGFSRNIDNYPTWDDFVQLLKDELKLDTDKELAFDSLPNNLEKTEFYIREIGKKQSHTPILSSRDDYNTIYETGRECLIDKIQDIFSDHKNNFDNKKWSTHLILLKKFKKFIYTTNWDNSLERSEINNGNSRLNPKPNYALSKEGNGDGKPRIIKYHGDYQKSGKRMLVACLTDYQQRMSFDNCLDIKLKSDLLRYDFLLLGYSFSDPNIHLMIHHLSEIITKTNKALNGNYINTSIYMVALEKPDDLRVNLLKDTFFSLKPYFLLDPSDYHPKCSVRATSKCVSCIIESCPKCGENRCRKCGHKCGSPIEARVKVKTEALLKSL